MPASLATMGGLAGTLVTQGAPAANSRSITSLRVVKRMLSAPPSVAMTATNFLSITFLSVIGRARGASGREAGVEIIPRAGLASSRASLGKMLGVRLWAAAWVTMSSMRARKRTVGKRKPPQSCHREDRLRGTGRLNVHFAMYTAIGASSAPNQRMLFFNEIGL